MIRPKTQQKTPAGTLPSRRGRREGAGRDFGGVRWVALVALVAGAGLALGLASLRQGWLRRDTAGESREGAARWFEDTAHQAGIDFHMSFLESEQGEKFKINLYDHGAGVAVGDYDGDGRDDIYFCNQLGPNALYHNNGDGTFTDVTWAAGDVSLADRISVAATFADYDDDGDEDLYVTTTRAGNVLFRNRGDGTFEDVTEKVGLTLRAHSEQGFFFDADGDRDLDLLVTNTAKWTTPRYDESRKYYLGPEGLFDLASSVKEPNRFYRNRGDGTFEDATDASGLAGPGWGGDCAVFDFDGDGDLDVYAGNMFGWGALYENDGRGHFKDVTRDTLKRPSWGTMGVKAFDYDGDGRLDLFMVDMHSDMWMEPDYPLDKIPWAVKFPSVFGPAVERHLISEAQGQRMLDALAFQKDQVVCGNTLFHNLGGGKFEEVSDKAGAETLWPWGIATGDFDGDGFEDAFLASGMGYPYAYTRSPLLVNQRNGTFVDKSGEAGLDPPPGGTLIGRTIGGKPATKSSRSAATADFDGDGRLDLVVNNFNDRPFLLMNRGPKRNFVEFRLTGTASLREALGAVVTLHVGARTLVRQVTGAGGYLAQSSLMLHFGLGDATKIDLCEIRWPSGKVQKIENLAINTLHKIKEGAP